jgi:TadE-like protein
MWGVALIKGMSGGLVGCRSVARRLLHETRSDTAVEFAMIGSAFFLFIFAIFVISIDQFWQMTLDDAVRNATRQMQINSSSNPVTTGDQFKAKVCDEFGVAAPNCNNTLQYSVQIAPYFGNMTNVTLQSTGSLSSGSQFPSTITTSTPTMPQFLLVQVAYPLPFKILAVPGGVATENGTSSLYSAVATVMEP